MRKERDYPPHIYDSVRIKVATSYIKHELRKLLWRVPKIQWPAIDKNVADWMNSPWLATPRDFWNGFHGICMGFKLKIGLIYFVTAENITWKKEEIPVEELTFGVDLQQTRLVKPGVLSAREVIEFYADPKNKKIKEEQKKFTESFQTKAPRSENPIIVTQKSVDGKDVLSVYEGNWRMIKAILEDKKTITAFVGRFTSEKKELRNYWIPTTILMEILYFAKEAFEKEDKQLFQHHMEVLKNMLVKSESAIYELKERALIHKQPFRNEVLKALDLLK